MDKFKLTNLYTCAVQKKLSEAESYLKQALQEARTGFGEDDAHVAGACNNLAELHRLKKEFPEAEALYQEVQFAIPTCLIIEPQ